MLIKMKELSSTAFDAEDANLLKVEIKKALAKEEKITIDFDSITHYTTLFFNFSLLPYARQFGKQKYDATFTIINLSDFGKEVYSWFYEDAVEHPIKYTAEQMKEIAAILNDSSDLD